MTNAAIDTISVNVNGAQNFFVFDVPADYGYEVIGVRIERENMKIGGRDCEPIFSGRNAVSVFRNGEEIPDLRCGNGSYFEAPEA